MPAVAVRRVVLALSGFIWRKAFAGCARFVKCYKLNSNFNKAFKTRAIE